MIYFIRAGLTGPVKIGRSQDPWKRLTCLQTSNTDDLSLLRVIFWGDKIEEKWLHRHFRHLRIRGEWFRYDEEMETILPPLPDLRGFPEIEELRRRGRELRIKELQSPR